jgi:heme exporter protein CcmD
MGKRFGLVNERKNLMSGASMGAYGTYVWGCFALTAAVLVICEWRARTRHRHVYRDIEVRVKALGDTE